MIQVLMLSAVLSLAGFSESSQTTMPEDQEQTQAYSYVYIAVTNSRPTEKFEVRVDFGDTQEQLKAGKAYSELLTKKNSYAAVLNYMVDNGFELVETLDYSSIYAGSGGSSGVVFLMREKK